MGLFGDFCCAHGSEEQKKDYLPRITGGEIRFARAYTEPDAGYDLSSVQTLARADGDAANQGWFADLVVWAANPLAIQGPTGWTLEDLGQIPEGDNDAARLDTVNAFIERFQPIMTVVGGVIRYQQD